MTTAELALPKLPLSLRLTRPGASDPTLRAWDAADELLIEQAHRLAEGRQPRVLVVDDQFGALSLGVSALSPTVVADSATLPEALEYNGRQNPELSPPLSIHSWLNPPTGPFDLVIMRIPRQADYLAWLLRWLNEVMTDSAQLLAGGMIKHLPDRSVDVFAKAVQTDQVLPARKKARVIVCSPGRTRLGEWAECWKGYEGVAGCARIEALPAVFARDRLDIGSQLLLPHVIESVGTAAGETRVLDLACGNGLLGLAALGRCPGLAVTFSDVSSQAVLSARRNVERSFPGGRVSCVHRDGVPEDQGPWDLILLNPPFHEGGVVGDHIALRLFSQASRNLATGGRLLMVGNRHLGYHRSLERFFTRVQQRDASPKFVVFEASND